MISNRIEFYVLSILSLIGIIESFLHLILWPAIEGAFYGLCSLSAVILLIDGIIESSNVKMPVHFGCRLTLYVYAVCSLILVSLCVKTCSRASLFSLIVAIVSYLIFYRRKKANVIPISVFSLIIFF